MILTIWENSFKWLWNLQSMAWGFREKYFRLLKEWLSVLETITLTSSDNALVIFKKSLERLEAITWVYKRFTQCRESSLNILILTNSKETKWKLYIQTNLKEPIDKHCQEANHNNLKYSTHIIEQCHQTFIHRLMNKHLLVRIRNRSPVHDGTNSAKTTNYFHWC